jgi:hypothetical protein
VFEAWGAHRACSLPTWLQDVAFLRDGATLAVALRDTNYLRLLRLDALLQRPGPQQRTPAHDQQAASSSGHQCECSMGGAQVRRLWSVLGGLERVACQGGA